MVWCSCGRSGRVMWVGCCLLGIFSALLVSCSVLMVYCWLVVARMVLFGDGMFVWARCSIFCLWVIRVMWTWWCTVLMVG